MEQKTVTVSLGKVFKWLGLVILVGVIVFIFLASQSGFNSGFYNTFGFIFSLIKMSFPIVTLVFAVTFVWQLIKSFTSKTPEDKHIHTSKLTKIFIAVLIWFLLFAGFTIINGSMGVSVGDDVSYNEITTIDFDGGGSRTLANPMRQSFGSNWFNQNENGSIADTREFMKVSYSGNIKTRDVKDTARDVRGIIRDMDGRVDSENVSEKYGYINFVIPKSNFDDFRDEIESITHKKLYTENTSSQNLLNQKQNIEEQNNLATKSLIELQEELKTLSAKHTQTVATLKKELTTIQKQLADTRTLISKTTDSSLLTNLYLQESYEQTGENQAKQRINSENTQYANQKNALDQAISGNKGTLQSIANQDQKFTENIETVNGSVNIQWINSWQLAKTFSPIHPIFIIAILFIIIWYILRKTNKVPMFVFKW